MDISVIFELIGQISLNVYFKDTCKTSVIESPYID